MVLKIYLDNDVFIRASKDKPLDKLKVMAHNEKVTLYTSRLGYVEHSEWPTQFKARYAAVWATYRRQKTTESIAAIHAVNEERRAMEAGKANEWAYWNDVPFAYPESTFEGLMIASILGEEVVVSSDLKGELRLLADLHYSHNIKPSDAQHLMIAHSAALDAVLTWDNRLIKRAAKVPWLHPRVETPDVFLAMINSQDKREE
jgi:hypothetical protein